MLNYKYTDLDKEAVYFHKKKQDDDDEELKPQKSAMELM